MKFVHVNLNYYSRQLIQVLSVGDGSPVSQVDTDMDGRVQEDFKPAQDAPVGPWSAFHYHPQRSGALEAIKAPGSLPLWKDDTEGGGEKKEVEEEEEEI